MISSAHSVPVAPSTIGADVLLHDYSKSTQITGKELSINFFELSTCLTQGTAYSFKPQLHKPLSRMD